MNTNAFQVQGDEVRIGWMIGHAPLALRGIRCADGDDGTPTPPAPQPPAPVPTPPAPTPPAPKAEGKVYSEDYVKSLRGEAQSHREKGEATAAELKAEREARAAEKAELDALRAEKAETERVGQITAAAKDIADVDALLDSTAFAKSIEGVDVTDAGKLSAAITEFVEANPRFAAAEPGTKPPTRQQTPPTGGGQKTGPSSLGGAIGSHYSGS